LKRAFIVAGVVIIILAGLGFYFINEIQQREALRNVEVSVYDVAVESIGFTSATLKIKLKMFNPNSITATLDRADYNLYGNDILVGSGVIPTRVDIPAHSSTIITTTFDLSYSGAAKVIWSALPTGKVTWKIKGTAYFDTPVGSITVPFEG
jgi:LEA14-like dessication related protein